MFSEAGRPADQQRVLSIQGMGIPRIEDALSRISPDSGPLEAAGELRTLLPAPVARWAAEQRELRVRAAKRIDGAERWCLTRRGLEQATPSAVARWRAARVAARAPGIRVFDATAGLGSDAAALAAAGHAVLAADRDPLLARYCAHNLAVSGHAAPVVVAEAERPPLSRAARSSTALVLDPDRRIAGRRSLDPARWSPGWAAVQELVQDFPAGCLKLAPGVDVADCPLAAGPGAGGGTPALHWTWVSRVGELVETGLWWGALAGDAQPGVREAVALDRDGAAVQLAGTPRFAPSLAAEEAAEIRWIAEPDPAVIRADLVGLLAELAGLAPLAPGLAYLGGSAPPRDPAQGGPAPGLLRSWRVLASAPADRKRVRAMLGEHGVGPLTVKKRGHPDTAEVLAKRFRGPGTAHGLLVLGRLERGHRAWLVEPTT